MLSAESALASDKPKDSQRAYQQLRQMIVSLKLQPGEPIDEKRISAQLGLGRTPVREAFLKLAEHKLIEVMARKGTFVTPIRLEDLRAVEELRWHLESLATRWAAERIGEDDLLALRDLIDGAESGAFAHLPDWDVEVDRSLHLMIARAARNPFLAEHLERLYDHSVRMLYATRKSMAPAIEELPDYRFIVNAIAEHDPELAVLGMQRHLRASRNLVAAGIGVSLGANLPVGPEPSLGQRRRG